MSDYRAERLEDAWTEAKARLAEAERLLRLFLPKPTHSERNGCACHTCTTSREARAFLEGTP